MGCCWHPSPQQPQSRPKLLSGNGSPFATPQHTEDYAGCGFSLECATEPLSAVQRLLSAVAGSSEDAWLYRIDSAVGLLQEQLEADLACLHAVYEGGYAYAALSASGVGADEQQRGFPCSIQQDPANSVSVLLTLQLHASALRSSAGAIRASAPPVHPATCELPGALDKLPSDWQRLAERHGMQHFIAVPCCSGGVVAGVLMLASRQGELPPGCWHAGVLGAVGAALALLLQPRQVSIAASTLTDVHLARNVDELVRAVRRGVHDLVVATTYLPPTLRVALIRSDGSAAAVFEEHGQRRASYSRFSVNAGGEGGSPFNGGGGAGVPEVLQPQAGSSRRSMDTSRPELLAHGSQHAGQPCHGRERTMSALTASNPPGPDGVAVAQATSVPRLLQSPASLSARGGLGMSETGAGPDSMPQAAGPSFSRLSMPSVVPDGSYSRASLPDRVFAAAGLPLAGSFSMLGAGSYGPPAAIGSAKVGARGHTLSLGNTLLGEALQKDAGLWISDCTLYLQEARTFPRDIVVSRGSRAVHSIAVCGGRSAGSPLLGAYCVYGSVLPRQLLRAVTLELEQVLKLLAPSVAARLASPVLADEWRYLHDELLDPAKVDSLKRPPRSSSSVPCGDFGPGAAAANGPQLLPNGLSASPPAGAQSPPQQHPQGTNSPAGLKHSGSGAGGVGSGAGGLANGAAHHDSSPGQPAPAGPSAAPGCSPREGAQHLPSGIFVASASQGNKPDGEDPQAQAAGPALEGLARSSFAPAGPAAGSRTLSQPQAGQSLLPLCTPSLVDGIGPGSPGLAALRACNEKPVTAVPIPSAPRAALLAALGAAADAGPAASSSMGSGAGGLTGASGASVLSPFGSPSLGPSPAEAIGCKLTDGSVGASTVGTEPGGVVARAVLTAPSFTVEAVRSNLGGGLRRAPLISGLHERLAAAQASRLVHGSAVEHQEELGAIEVHEKIGEGGYGEVYRGLYDGTEAAIKIVYEPNNAQSSILPSLGVTALHTGDEASPGSARTRLCDAFELTVSVSVNHPHIVQVLTFFTDVYVHVERGNGSHERLPTVAGPQPLRPGAAGEPAAGPEGAVSFLTPQAAGSPRFPHAQHGGGGGAAGGGPPRVTLLPYPHPMASCQLSTIDVTIAQFADYAALQAAMASNGSAAAQAVNASPPAMVICMEYCDAGSLTEAIARGAFRMPALGLYGTTRPNMKAIYMTLLEVALALRHLHALRLVHCDLKPSNVLLRSSPRDHRGFTAKLSDFGLVRLMEPCGEGGRLVIPRGVQHGTVTHMAPEVLSHDKSLPHDASLDIYAFGIIMHQIVYGTRLYAGVDIADIPKRVVREGMRPRFISNVPAEYSHLAEACWAAKPEARPTAAGLVASLKQLMGLGQRLHGQRRYSAMPPQRQDRPAGLLLGVPTALARSPPNAGSVPQHCSSGLGLGLAADTKGDSSYSRVMSFAEALPGGGACSREAQGERGNGGDGGGAGSSSISRSGGMRTRSLSYGAFPVHIL